MRMEITFPNHQYSPLSLSSFSRVSKRTASSSLSPRSPQTQQQLRTFICSCSRCHFSLPLHYNMGARVRLKTAWAVPNRTQQDPTVHQSALSLASSSYGPDLTITKRSSGLFSGSLHALKSKEKIQTLTHTHTLPKAPFPNFPRGPRVPCHACAELALHRIRRLFGTTLVHTFFFVWCPFSNPIVWDSSGSLWSPGFSSQSKFSVVTLLFSSYVSFVPWSMHCHRNNPSTEYQIYELILHSAE